MPMTDSLTMPMYGNICACLCACWLQIQKLGGLERTPKLRDLYLGVALLLLLWLLFLTVIIVVVFLFGRILIR